MTFQDQLAAALGLNPAATHTDAHIILTAANMKARIDAIDRANPGLWIPGPDSPVSDCTAALKALWETTPAPTLFEATPVVRNACAIILTGLITGQLADTDGKVVLRRPQAQWIERLFRAAGWNNVTAGGLSNSPPNTGDNELWAVSTT